MSDDLAWKLADLRGQIAELGSAIRQLRQAGMESAPAQLLITRKRAELESLLKRGNDSWRATQKAVQAPGTGQM
jgi:hypothetical protein